MNGFDKGYRAFKADDFYGHVEGCTVLVSFAAMLNRNHIPAFFPNIEKSPWHVQAEINGTLVNFWPHTMKWQEEYKKSHTVLDWGEFNPSKISKAEEEMELFE